MPVCKTTFQMKEVYAVLLYFSIVGLLAYWILGQEIHNINKRGKSVHLNEATSSQASTVQKPLHVIIVTQMRSGSTFAGELLNQNNQFSYFFEPLYEFRHHIYGNKTNILSFVQVPLKNVLLCRFKAFTSLQWWANKSRRSKWDCSHSNVVQMSPLCKFYKKSQIYWPKRSVHNYLDILETVCKNRIFRAVKTIRVADIGDLQQLVEDTDLNVKIVHLVRDPRAVYHSRMAISNSTDNTSNLCQRLETNIQYWINTPRWLQNRYMLLRYEDLAEKPFQIANKLYNFLDIPMPLSVKQWILLNTLRNEGDKWSTTRNSSWTARTWRFDMNIHDVFLVQSQCNTTMTQLGYRLVSSQDALTNVNFRVVDPLWVHDPEFDMSKNNLSLF
ncbi:carbohydrate sulfotransferase 1-like [Amphiura filiformis]|uniref:carbohydrate sulfotransferase 1-like n=1 Tax=Amphiura filiformis TaxID=82378 RepID=UPI003B2159DC